MTIDEYVRRVRAALRVRNARAGLDELRDALAELSEAVGEDRACAEFGAPEEYAAALDAAFAEDQPDEFDPPPAGRLFGIPVNWSVDATWWRRLFDPSDTRLLVPKAFGWGYSVNLGAAAVRLGLLRPDDIGPDTLAELRTLDAASPLVATAVVAAANLAHAALARRGDDDLRDAIVAAAIVAAAALPTATKQPVIQRLTAQAFANFVLGAALGKAIDRHRRGYGVVAVAAGVATAVLGLTLPIRSAVERAARKENDAR